MPCVVSSSISSSAECPAASAWSAATGGQTTMEPRMPSSLSSPSVPGRSSSIGKESTSVGPSSSIHCTCSSDMMSTSTNRISSSACGCTPIASSTCRDRAANSSSSRRSPDSLVTSMLIGGGSSRCGVCARSSGPLRASAGGSLPPADLGVAGLVVGVGVDDVGHQPVAHHVGAGQLAERDVLDVAEDLLDHLQPGDRPTGQVHLGDVPGDHDPDRKSVV